MDKNMEEVQGVTLSQKNMLVDMVQSNFLQSLNKGRSFGEHIIPSHIWAEIATVLNDMGPFFNDASGWSDYFNTLKSETRQKILNLRREQNKTGGGTPSQLILSELDLKIAMVYGKDHLDGLQDFGELGFPGRGFEAISALNSVHSKPLNDHRRATLDANASTSQMWRREPSANSKGLKGSTVLKPKGSQFYADAIASTSKMWRQEPSANSNGSTVLQRTGVHPLNTRRRNISSTSTASTHQSQNRTTFITTRIIGPSESERPSVPGGGKNNSVKRRGSLRQQGNAASPSSRSNENIDRPQKRKTNPNSTYDSVTRGMVEQSEILQELRENHNETMKICKEIRDSLTSLCDSLNPPI